MKLYHGTDVAQAILRDGFRNAEGNYGRATVWLTGVFVSDEPLTVNEGAKGEQVLEVDLPYGQSAWLNGKTAGQSA